MASARSGRRATASGRRSGVTNHLESRRYTPAISRIRAGEDHPWALSVQPMSTQAAARFRCGSSNQRARGSADFKVNIGSRRADRESGVLPAGPFPCATNRLAGRTMGYIRQTRAARLVDRRFRASKLAIPAVGRRRQHAPRPARRRGQQRRRWKGAFPPTLSTRRHGPPLRPLHETDARGRDSPLRNWR